MLVGLIAGLAASVSAYEPMLVEGRTWTYVQHSHAPGLVEYVRCIEGDTVVDGKTYRRLVDAENGAVKAYMREEAEKVYRLKFNEDGTTDFGNETLLYDFSIPVDSTFTIQGISEYDGGLGDYQLTVLKSETKVVSDCASIVKTVARIYDFGAGNYGVPLTFVERLGCLDHATLETIYIDPYPTGQVYFPYLYTVKDKDGTLLYDYQKYNGIESNIVDNNSDGRMYDLMGREIREPQRGTVYIQDGRKKVQR